MVQEKVIKNLQLLGVGVAISQVVTQGVNEMSQVQIPNWDH